MYIICYSYGLDSSTIFLQVFRVSHFHNNNIIVIIMIMIISNKLLLDEASYHNGDRGG